MTTLEHYTIKASVMASFEAIRDRARMGDLVSFHATHKLLFLAYDEVCFRRCGTVAANHDHFPPEKVYQIYAEQLEVILSKPAKRKSMANSLYHGYGWIAKHLSPVEKNVILGGIEKYRREKMTLQQVTELLKCQALRLGHTYLLHQVLLYSFPSVTQMFREEINAN